MTRPALIGERGSVSLLALAAVGLSVVLCLGIARVGGAAVLQARADTAADAAALAGADALALGRGPSSALRSARAAASLNHARLVSCTCAGAEAEVVEAAGITTAQLIGTVHAAEHGLIGMLPLFTICDRWDVGGVSMALHPQTGDPTIFVYDGYPGGAGIAELAFADVRALLRAAHELVSGCPCDDGCPSCVQSPKCGNWNEYLDKQAAISVLEVLGAAASPEPATPRS